MCAKDGWLLTPKTGFEPRLYLLAIVVHFHCSTLLFSQPFEDSLRLLPRGGASASDYRMITTYQAIFANGRGFRSIDFVSGKNGSISFGDVRSETVLYGSELEDDRLLFVLTNRDKPDQLVLVVVSSIGVVQSHELQLASSYQFGGMIAKRYAVFGDEAQYVAIDCNDLSKGAVNEGKHVFSRSELKTSAYSRLARFQVIDGTSSLVEVTQVGNGSGRASVFEISLSDSKSTVKASWDAVYSDSHGGLSVSRDKGNGAMLVWTLSNNAPQIDCHTIRGELVKTHRLPDIELGLCTWGPNFWNVEKSGRTLTGIHMRDGCEWNFDFATDLARLPTNFDKRLMGRIQGDDRNFMIIETYKDKVSSVSIMDESSLEVKSHYVFSQNDDLAFFEARSGNGILLGSFDHPMVVEIDRNSGAISKRH